MTECQTAPEATGTSDLPEEVRGQVVPIIDFGSQYVQLIARRVREAGVFSVLVPADIPVDELVEMQPAGIILSGGPGSAYKVSAPHCDPALFDMGVPILGICYGMQVACAHWGGEVAGAPAREYGRAELKIETESDLLAGVPPQSTVWMSHGDQVRQVPPGFQRLATTPTCPWAAVKDDHRRFYGVQFHPEVTHTPHGIDILRNFLYRICGATGSWRMSDFRTSEIERIRRRVGKRRVLCGLSGGVDSSVVAALLHEAIGDQLTCIFVDNGLLRKDEKPRVETTFRNHFNVDLQCIDASDAFLEDLAGVTDPQEKRRLIGHRFINVFEVTSRAYDDASFLAQGTLYPDVIESGHSLAGSKTDERPTANIKMHHNVGGLPDNLGFELVEPLRALFKDEVRHLGKLLGLPEDMVWRHPFPGPGLAVRVLGEVTREKLDLLRDCDEILLDEIEANGLYRQTAQVFAVLLPVKAVGVMGDGRTYEHVVAVRAVESQDFMTADWARIPYDVLATISNRIINEVQGVNRVVYDISSKPPATIEWE